MSTNLRKIKKHIPNTISCLNLFCGCLSIVCAFEGRLDFAAFLILFAAGLDFFDGFAARLLKAYSEMGKQLDSLADVVSFGVAPASIMYILLISSAQFPFGSLIASAAYIIAVFSALRLAKFNIDTRQSEVFIGLPTPANAIFICSFALISSDEAYVFVNNVFLLLAATVILSFLLVAELPLFSLKFKSFDWKSNKIRYIFIAISILVLLIMHWAGLALIILIYIALSIIILLKKRMS